MSRVKRPPLAAEGARVNREQLARAGSELRRSRLRRHLMQRQLAARVGVAQSTVSRVERGYGGSLSVDVWQRLFLALGRRLVLEAARDPQEDVRDAGHLGLQELVLRLGRRAGYERWFELATRPQDPSRSADGVSATTGDGC